MNVVNVVNRNPVQLLRRLKAGILRVSEHLGVSSLVLESAWRQQRLLILGYHGIALQDEHQWNPLLFMHPDMLRQRLQVLKQQRCSVLPLGEAVQRLYAATLPKRSVAITFDDGFYDFYRLAHPILQEFGFPVTLSITTYYSHFNRPVFDPMCSYLLWKGRGQMLDWPELSAVPLLLNDSARVHAETKLKAFALERRLSGTEKDELLGKLAYKVGIDYENLCAKRILHLVNPHECRQLADEGVDLQLHTHRHRVSSQRLLFLGEIDENRRRIESVSKRPATHFCYPGGVHRPEFLHWLRERDVVLAISEEPGLASRNSEPLLLPRLLDSSMLKESEFLGWVSGVSSLLPYRIQITSNAQGVEEGVEVVESANPVVELIVRT